MWGGTEGEWVPKKKMRKRPGPGCFSFKPNRGEFFVAGG